MLNLWVRGEFVPQCEDAGFASKRYACFAAVKLANAYNMLSSLFVVLHFLFCLAVGNADIAVEARIDFLHLAFEQVAVWRIVLHL